MSLVEAPHEDCAICATLSDMPESHVILCDAHWVVTRVGAAPGFVLIAARHHVEGQWELSDDEAFGLGPLIRDLSGAVRQASGAERVHMVSFGEVALHYHFLLIPRLAGEVPLFDPMLSARRAQEIADAERAETVTDGIRTALAAARKAA